MSFSRTARILLLGANIWYFGEGMMGPLFAVFAEKVGGDILKSTNCKTLVRIINRPFKCKTNFISISILFDGLPRTMMAENNSRKNVFSL